ncbi:MAG TPA: gamma-glutamyltransferase, partial [Candidatus Polarisedimenticolia bacterium]|nr:gamma-glutamyltransferase [Candidatus Polarisedimenticolia bacterium]
MLVGRAGAPAGPLFALALLFLAAPGSADRALAQGAAGTAAQQPAKSAPVNEAAPIPAPEAEPARQPAVALRQGETFYPVVRGRRGAVAAGNPFTAQAGFRMLLAGGNAIDAGVAMVLAGAMTEFDSYGFGGEVPILIHSAPQGKVAVINGVGFAPQGVKADLFDPKVGIPGEGPLCAIVPSVLDNCLVALARFGTRSFCEVSAPARELAAGFPMPEDLARRLEGDAAALRRWPTSARVFLPGDRAPRPGEMFRQRDLSTTLERLCEAEKRAAAKGWEGALQAVRDEFYRGTIARELARGAREAGGLLGEADLAAFKARIEEPVSAPFGEYTLYKAGYWTQGPVLLHTLGLLSGFDLKTLGHNSAAYIHVVTEALKLAFADRDRYFGDPDFVKVPARGYLSTDYIRERARLIDLDHASLEKRPGDPWKYDAAAPPPGAQPAGGGSGDARSADHGAEPGSSGRDSRPRDTTSMEAVDAQGNLFSATASGAWLPSVIAGTTGIPMSERLESFLLEPGHPNDLAPHKRPRITLTPTIVHKGGKPWMALSSVGGDYQDQVILQVFLNLAVFGMNVQQAIEAPKFTTDHLVDSFAGHPFKPGVLNLEDRLYADAGLVAALGAKGHKVQSTRSWGNG